MKRPDKPAMGYAVPPKTEPKIDDDAVLFRSAVRDVAPLAASGKVVLTGRHPQPIPRQAQDDRQPGSEDSLSDHVPSEMATGDEGSFLRPGLSRQTLRRLRRGYWKIQAELDLHGFTRDEARQQLVFFLDASRNRGFRCVRVIHGKGLSSRNHEPVLKARIGSWLSQRDDVLAFCQARPEDGGSGAVLALLKVSVLQKTEHF
ncbi:Smr/MutS family protein [Nitrosovibrio sp. Nv4]|uniref:Smr/MutS family protein n=1 Tax=Nitrosovibrio sp. Nv4 TaxID=1945880 RepID=UPI000BDD18D1|nr:Smr/MutS family protein [Nitrosovibrio sp. Nv4]SOD40245.1 DNA-nicking endonuclease, Smr domain [Nitrosovibrio sp. Nv4]